MVQLIKDKMPQIISACEKYKVKHLYLFGSAAREKDFNEKSDIDFLYNFKKDEIPFPDYADNFFDFLFTLEGMLKRTIDLIPEEKMKNPFLVKSVNADKIKLYG